MSTFIKAVDVIHGHITDNLGFDSPVAYDESKRLAKALADAGVLLDLPGPDVDELDPIFGTPTPKQWELTDLCTAGVVPDEDIVRLWFHCVAEDHLTIDEARNIGLSLLAAAEHAENNADQRDAKGG